MPLTALLELRLKPDMLDAAYATVRVTLADTRQFPGCEGVDVLVDRDDRTHIVVYERWESAEADAAYRYDSRQLCLSRTFDDRWHLGRHVR